MTYKIELKNGETFSGSYNLAGLTEAYKWLLQKRAEATQAAEREFEDLKKQLAALE